jgi:hypothetical protein
MRYGLLAIIFLFICLVFNYAYGFLPSQKQLTCIYPRFKKLVAEKDNQFTVVVYNHDDANLDVSISEGAFLSKSFEEAQGGYVYHIKPYGTLKTIVVYVKSLTGDTTFCTASFKVVSGPAITGKPIVSMGNYTKGNISIKEAAKIKTIEAKVNRKFPFAPTKLVVQSYTFAIAPKTGQAFVMMVTGDKIPETVKARMKELNEGDLIVIGNVQASDKNGPIMLSGLTLTVK